MSLPVAPVFVSPTGAGTAAFSEAAGVGAPDAFSAILAALTEMPEKLAAENSSAALIPTEAVPPLPVPAILMQAIARPEIQAGKATALFTPQRDARAPAENANAPAEDASAETKDPGLADSPALPDLAAIQSGETALPLPVDPASIPSGNVELSLPADVAPAEGDHPAPARNGDVAPSPSSEPARAGLQGNELARASLAGAAPIQGNNLVRSAPADLARAQGNEFAPPLSHDSGLPVSASASIAALSQAEAFDGKPAAPAVGERAARDIAAPPSDDQQTSASGLQRDESDKGGGRNLGARIQSDVQLASFNDVAAAAERIEPRGRPVAPKPGEKVSPKAGKASVDAGAPPAGPAPAAPRTELQHTEPKGTPSPGSDDKPAENFARAPLAQSAQIAPAANALQPNAAQANTPQANVAFSLFQNAAFDASNVAPEKTTVPVRLSFVSGKSDAPSGFDSLALRIAAHSASGESRFAIRLDPPELGRIEVNLNVNAKGEAEAELRADKPQTLEFLQKDSSSLERALKDAGLNLSGGLAFSLKGEGKSKTWRDGQGSGRARNMQIESIESARANAALSTATALAERAHGFGASRLDIRV